MDTHTQNKCTCANYKVNMYSVYVRMLTAVQLRSSYALEWHVPFRVLFCKLSL